MADLKFIVSEVNKLINTDYNMISFDALPIANLVQILVDTLHDFGALSKVNYQLSSSIVSVFIAERNWRLELMWPFMGSTVNGGGGGGRRCIANSVWNVELMWKWILIRLKLIINKKEMQNEVMIKGERNSANVIVWQSANQRFQIKLVPNSAIL